MGKTKIIFVIAYTEIVLSYPRATTTKLKKKKIRLS